MKKSRILYRARQFWETLTARWRPRDEAYPAAHLSPTLLDLFLTMSPAEQHHGIALAKKLENAPAATPDLITAALLHDVGKTLAPPTLWERVAVVLVEHFAADPMDYLDKAWFWELKRAYVTRTHHAAWGAELAEKAGASPRAVALIRQHHDEATQDKTLKLLQLVDDS